jgi:hypothetical protein
MILKNDKTIIAYTISVNTMSFKKNEDYLKVKLTG